MLGIEIRSRQDQMVSLGEIIVIAGKNIFLLMSCFKKMATGGVQPFFQWLSNKSACGSPTCTRNVGHIVQNSTTVHSKQSSLASRFKIDSSLAMGMVFFIRGVPLLKPRLYTLGEIQLPPAIIYSDAEWTVLDHLPWLSKGLAGSHATSRRKSHACSILSTTFKTCLSKRKYKKKNLLLFLFVEFSLGKKNVYPPLEITAILKRE